MALIVAFEMFQLGIDNPDWWAAIGTALHHGFHDFEYTKTTALTSFTYLKEK